MHLALYGGSFDPPHNGHLALCLFAAELLRVDRLVISVSNNPFKGGYLAPDADRKRMAQLLADELGRVGVSAEVSGWELEKRQPSYTVDLVRYIHSVYSPDSLTLLIGEDSFCEITSWKSWQSLFSLCRIAVFGRSSCTDIMAPEVFPPDSIRFIDFDCPHSSTAVRQAVASGLPVTALLPSSIRHYIAEHGLYRTA